MAKKTKPTPPDIELIQSEKFDIALVDNNTGQIPGVPENPREMTEMEYKKLLKSLQRDSRYTAISELKLYPYEGRWIAIGGNMRLQAMKELGWTTVIGKPIPEDTDAETLTRWILLDNANFGKWDFDKLANQFDTDLLDDLCIEIPPPPDISDEEEAKDDNCNPSDLAPEVPRSRLGDIYQLGQHRLIVGDSTKSLYLDALMQDELADCLITDPPYNVNYEGSNGKKIANDKMSDGNFQEFLFDAFSVANEHLKQGGAFYIWHADSEGYNFRTAAKRVGWTIRQCLIWNKNSFVLGRQDYQWKHEPCQPAGTMVETTTGAKPIEELRDGDRVISFDKLSGQVKGRRNGGYEIKTASRDYDGLLYSIRAAGKTTRTTDNHEFSVRFNAEARTNYCTYLMRRGRWWRVGQTKAYDARQFGLKTRFNQEHADEIWLLSIHEDKVAAQVMEQILTCKYGIPYTIWVQDRFAGEPKRSSLQIASIYDALDLDEMERSAHRLLHDFGRSERFPLITKASKHERFSTRVTAQIRACNLVPELMQVPIPTGGSQFEWCSIDAVTAEPFTGKVYSLAVQTYQHYIADGIITHNCLYGWKDGGSHYFVSNRSLTTVLEEKLDLDAMTKDELKKLLASFLGGDVPTTVFDENKPLRNAEHPMMKPVPLIGKQIKNSSRWGEIVLDVFGGSGTTLIAAEQLGRQCRMVEFDPVYADVIVKRWEELTGEQARYLGNCLDEAEKANSTNHTP